MTSEIKTIVTFESSLFNTSEPKEYFINPCCYGEDVAKWLVEQLRAKGYEAGGTLGQEDFGWYFTFRMSGTEYCFVIGHRPKQKDAEEDKEEVGLWIGWLERSCGFVASMLGGRKRGIQAAPSQAIHAILLSSPQVWNIRWHLERDFNSGREELGTPEPAA